MTKNPAWTDNALPKRKLTDPELKTAAALRELALHDPENAKLFNRAADEMESLVDRIESLWQEHRWCGD
jgi:hypothetical protein